MARAHGTQARDSAGSDGVGFRKRVLEKHARANKLKPATQHNYEDRLRRHILPYIGKRRLDELNARVAQDMKAAWIDLAPKTINSIIGVFHTMLNAAVKWGYLDRMPAKLTKVKEARRPKATYSFEQLQRVIEAAQSVGAQALVTLLLGVDAGLRRGEMAGLEWSDINLGNNSLTVQRNVWNGQALAPKGNRSRTLHMTDALREALKSLPLPHEGRILRDKNGRPLKETSVNEVMRRVEKQAGLEPTGKVHILRHTFCSHLAEQGVPAPAIQQLAGHADLTTTMGYMHVAPENLKSGIDLLNRRPKFFGGGNMPETVNPGSGKYL